MDRGAPRPTLTAATQVAVGFIGRVGLEKGVHVLASACALLDPALRARVQLVIAGDDRFVPGRRPPHGAGGAGLLRRPGGADGLDRAEGVLLPCRPGGRARRSGRSPSGWSPPRRWQRRCPVVVTDAGGLAEVVGPDHPWVVPRGDAAALARTLTEAIGALPADDVTAAQHRRWEVEYSPAAGRQHLQALVGRLVGPRRPRRTPPAADHATPDTGSDDRPEAYGEAPR